MNIEAKGQVRVSAEYYNKKFFLKHMQGWKRYSQEKIPYRFFDAMSLAEVKSNETILDIGSGRGEIAFLSANLGANVTAIDYSKSSINLINNKLKQYPLKKGSITPMVMNAQKLLFNKKSYDKIFFLEILEHLYPDEVTVSINEMIRVLKPGGKIIISTGPNRSLINPILFLSRYLLKMPVWESRKYHVNEQSYFSLNKLLKLTGSPYKIYFKDDTNWFYGQISESKNINYIVKQLIKIFNTLYDLKIFQYARKLPIINRVLCSSFLVEICKPNYRA